MTYTVYHLHSDYSFLDSCTKFADYVKLAALQGMKAIASTEHGKPSGWVEKKMACEKYGLKFIYGVEIYLTERLEPKVRDNYHTVLLAKNFEGVVEINRLIELSTRTDHMYYRNRITFDEFLSISPNVIKISACIQSPLNKLPHGHPQYMVLANAYDYYEIQHHNVQEQAEYNRYLFTLSQKTGKPLIAGTDTHSLNAYYAECRDILMEDKEQHYEGEDAFDLTWKSYEELVAAYEKQDALPRWAYMEAIENTNKMAESVVDFKLDKTPKYPILYGTPEADEQKLREIVWQMLDDKLEKGIIPRSQEEEFRRDIVEELEAFHKTNMSGFILSMSGIISWCRSNNIPIGPCRGSVGGSRVAYVSEIIDLNPVEYHTVFSRFCNENRVELGDIDVDCIEADRPKIFEYIINKFGEKHCARVSSYGTIADLSFIDDCGKGLAIKWERQHSPEKFDERGHFKKKTASYDAKNPYRPAILTSIKQGYKDDSEKTKKQYPDLFRYYDGFIGTKVSQSVHPAGMVISCDALHDNWGVFNKDGEKCLFLNMDEAHDVMLVKYDLLILKTVEVIAKCCKLAGKHYPRMHEIDFHDAAVWDDICRDQSAIFQFESGFAADALRRFQPRSVEDIAVVTAAIRPSGASYRDDLLARKVHHNPTKLIDEVLKDSLGYLVYQEQTISFLQIVCGLSAAYADTIRRAITKKKKEQVDEALPVILEGYCDTSDKTHDVAEQEAKEFLQVVEDASAYSFGKNHAIGYSLLSYLCGYYRHYYPEEFIAAYLSCAANDDDIMVGKALAKRLHITLTHPKFGQDNRDYYIDKVHHAISDSLASLKNVGLKDAEALFSLSDFSGKYFVDLLYRAQNFPGALNATVLRTLIWADYFSAFGKAGKLMSVYLEFLEGKNKITKNLIDATICKRMELLREYEVAQPDEDIPMSAIVPFDIATFGEPRHLYPNQNGLFAVLEVDTKYSPKVKLFNLAKGTTGVMKIKKPLYKERKIEQGNIIRIVAWKPTPAYRYVNGKSQIIPGVHDMWLDMYEVL